MKSLITLVAAILFGAIQMACACDVVMNEDSSSAHQFHETETHNSDQHHAPDSPCDGCEHCNDKPVFAETKTQTITFKIGQQVEPSIILASDNDFIEGAPSTGPPDKLVRRRSPPSLTPVDLKVRLLN